MHVSWGVGFLCARLQKSSTVGSYSQCKEVIRLSAPRECLQPRPVFSTVPELEVLVARKKEETGRRTMENGRRREKWARKYGGWLKYIVMDEERKGGGGQKWR
ncbi:hypothetical protein E2C01_066631 [Portunus trituberculatus]|uniref:Uncharacterized protein n=1 Tax=Portunus trituberculatus TaxID=210409 RepID=A0A5B7HRE2_PORTR|nr:hypothetical protein [Portunus trituberculatus]